MPFFNKKPTTAEKLGKVDDLLLDLETEANLTAKKMEKLEQQVRDFVKQGIGASQAKKKMLAAQANAKAMSLKTLQRKLQRDLAVYSAATMYRGGLEAQEIETEGALNALNKIAGAADLRDLRGVMAELAKGEQKFNSKLLQMQKQIEDMQDELTLDEFTDNKFLELMDDAEQLPTDEIDADLAEKLRFDTKKEQTVI